jgi:hypothetical protein
MDFQSTYAWRFELRKLDQLRRKALLDYWKGWVRQVNFDEIHTSRQACEKIVSEMGERTIYPFFLLLLLELGV